jgi:D-glycerate 3-kinase
MLEAAAIAALLTREALPAAYAETVDRWWRPLAGHIAGWRAKAGRPLLIGINGAQGSGKTTLCVFVEALLAHEHGLAVATLSLDDLYCTRAERHRLATIVHPLLATRGVPGTHDLPLATRTLDALLAGSGATAIPRFDKAVDDRRPRTAWPLVMAPLDVLLFEGWCIAATPQPESALAIPVNALETSEDPEMTWRLHANRALAGGYATLFARIDRLVMLRAPGFASVRGWRQQQESHLRSRAGAGAGMNPAAVDRFIQHYERLTRDMLAGLSPRADLCFDLDDAREILRLHARC